jgi:ribosomal protein S27AE
MISPLPSWPHSVTSPALYVELWDDAGAKKARKAKAASKTKFTCPDCSANAWAKPNTRLICGECDTQMEAVQVEAGETSD